MRPTIDVLLERIREALELAKEFPTTTGEAIFEHLETAEKFAVEIQTAEGR